MYNNSELSGAATSQSDANRYTVADILSRLSNGEAITPSFAEAPAIPSYVTTGTTPTLTPTTLANIEQSFIELSSLAPTSTTTTATYTAQDLSRQSGFVPPVINPGGANMGIKTEYYSDEYDDSDPEWTPSTKRMRGADGRVIEITPHGSPASTTSNPGPRRHTGPRPRRNEHLTPEENAKRGIRRERNKVAAAKCRQRRVDHTNRLINETENLEEEKATLENEIQTLQQQKEQLEFLLKAHKPMCSAKIPNQAGASSTVIVKAEPMDVGIVSTRPNSLPLVITTAAPATVTRTMPITSANVTEATGIAISTPSTGVFNTSLSLDIMTDGHTGLTPITSGPSCASQVQRNSSDSSPSEALASPTTLMAL